MRLSLFDFAIYEAQFWLELFGFRFGNTYVALLYVERYMEDWKVDVAGLRAVYLWWKYRE